LFRNIIRGELSPNAKTSKLRKKKKIKIPSSLALRVLAEDSRALWAVGFSNWLMKFDSSKGDVSLRKKEGGGRREEGGGRREEGHTTIF
jgi:hypothetical protein